jgi:hypothetical protein
MGPPPSNPSVPGRSAELVARAPAWPALGLMRNLRIRWATAETFSAKLSANVPQHQWFTTVVVAATHTHTHIRPPRSGGVRRSDVRPTPPWGTPASRDRTPLPPTTGHDFEGFAHGWKGPKPEGPPKLPLGIDRCSRGTRAKKSGLMVAREPPLFFPKAAIVTCHRSARADIRGVAANGSIRPRAAARRSRRNGRSCPIPAARNTRPDRPSGWRAVIRLPRRCGQEAIAGW